MACTSCKKKKVVETTTLEQENNTISPFKMRANTGVHQIQFGSGLFISNDNMTDEVAIKFLKENPNRISLFEAFPENWKELINPKTKSDKTSTTDGPSVSKSK